MTIADRLKPYQVAHSLIHRLEIYDVSRPVSQFRTASWNTLLYWQMLLDGAPGERSEGTEPQHVHEHHGTEDGYIYYPCPVCGLDRVAGRSFVPYSEYDVWLGKVNV